MIRIGREIPRRGPDARHLIAWLTVLAIAGTLCACGRYGPPKRRPQTTTSAAAVTSRIEAPRTSVPSA
ncbi:MAG: hypothetical protein R3F21_12950 [Myxococcota bacterium]